MTYFLKDREGRLFVTGDNRVGQTGLSRDIYPERVPEFVQLPLNFPVSQIFRYPSADGNIFAILIADDGRICHVGSHNNEAIRYTDQDGGDVAVVAIALLSIFNSETWNPVLCLLDSAGRLFVAGDAPTLIESTLPLKGLQTGYGSIHSFGIDMEDQIVRFTIEAINNRYRLHLSVFQSPTLVSRIHVHKDSIILISRDNRLMHMDHGEMLSIHLIRGLTRIKNISFIGRKVFIHDENDDVLHLQEITNTFTCVTTFLIGDVQSCDVSHDILFMRNYDGRVFIHYRDEMLYPRDVHLNDIDIDPYPHTS